MADQIWIPDSKRFRLPLIFRQLGLKQRDVAQALAVSPASISRFLDPGSSRINLRPETLRQLAEFLTKRLAESQAIKSLSAESLRSLEAEIAELLESKPSSQLPTIPHAKRLDFPETSAGRRMQTEFIAVPPNWTVGQTLDYMRETADLPERFFEMYVLDAEGRFLGAVPLDRLMRTGRPVVMTDLMEPERHIVRATDDQEEVARRFERYNLVTAPVIDTADRMVGVITFDDIIDVIEEEAEEDIKALQRRAEEAELASVPQRRHAAVEPLWDGSLLTIPGVPASTDQGEAGFASALRGMRNVLRSFADEISGEANTDRRFVAFVRQLADRIPEAVPPQHELFEIGHIEAVFTEYTRTVNDQWPNFLAARYHAIVLQFDRTMRQSEAWRDFKRNAREATFTDAQTREAAELANTAAAALRDDEAGEFVDSRVPQVLEQLADPRSSWQDDALGAIEAGKEELAADLIESTNNIFKAIAEVALPVVTDAAAAARRTAGRTTAAFWEEFEKGAVAEAKARGKPAGRAAVRWLLRFAKVTGGVAGVGGAGAGTYVGFMKLAAQYPEAFGWLEHLVQFFQHALPL